MKTLIRTHYPAIIATILVGMFVAFAIAKFVHLYQIGAI